MSKVKVPKIAKGPVTDRIEVSHGLYRILAGVQGGTGTAVGYLAARKIDVKTADTVDGAVEALKQALDGRAHRLRQTRAGDIPCSAEFQEVFSALLPVMSRRQAAILAAHRRQPDCRATPATLARLTDLGEAVVMTEYARLGRQVGGLLGFAPPANGLDRALSAILAVAEVVHGQDGEAVGLRLRPEVAAALAAIEPRPASQGV